MAKTKTAKKTYRCTWLYQINICWINLCHDGFNNNILQICDINISISFCWCVDSNFTSMAQNILSLQKKWQSKFFHYLTLAALSLFTCDNITMYFHNMTSIIEVAWNSMNTVSLVYLYLIYLKCQFVFFIKKDQHWQDGDTVYTWQEIFLTVVSQCPSVCRSLFMMGSS